MHYSSVNHIVQILRYSVIATTKIGVFKFLLWYDCFCIWMLYHCVQKEFSKTSTTVLKENISHVTRKPVFGVCDQVRHKPACSADETRLSLEISAIETRDIILSRQQTTKVLIRLRGCAG